MLAQGPSLVKCRLGRAPTGLGVRDGEGARGEACVGKRTYGGRRAAKMENDEGSERPGGLTTEPHPQCS
jgi:hypothetical protein